MFLTHMPPKVIWGVSNYKHLHIWGAKLSGPMLLPIQQPIMATCTYIISASLFCNTLLPSLASGKAVLVVSCSSAFANMTILEEQIFRKTLLKKYTARKKATIVNGTNIEQRI